MSRVALIYANIPKRDSVCTLVDSFYDKIGSHEGETSEFRTPTI